MSKTLDRDYILRALTPVERDVIIRGIEYDKSLYRFFILRGLETDKQSDRDFILDGKDGFGRDFILDTKQQLECDFVLDAIIPPESLVRYHFKEDEIQDFEITSGRLINEITIQYAYDFSEQKYQSSITKYNPLSKLLYGEAKRTLELRMIQHTRQAEKIADAVLYTSSIPDILCTFKHNLRSLYVEVGDIVNLTHIAGLGENGYQNALSLVSKKRLYGIEIDYELIMKPTGNLYRSELIMLTQTAGAGKEGITITYEHGVATITIYADVQGYPPVQGAEITINSVKKITDVKGQVRFNLDPGTYTAYIQASGYEDAEVIFTV